MKKYDESIQADGMKFEDCGGRVPLFLLPPPPKSLQRRNLQLLGSTFLATLNPSFPFILSDTPGEYKNRGDLDSDTGARKACKFDRRLLGPCSGLEDNNFGFHEGKPCLIVKLNRIVNFRPKVLLVLIHSLKVWKLIFEFSRSGNESMGGGAGQYLISTFSSMFNVLLHLPLVLFLSCLFIDLPVLPFSFLTFFFHPCNLESICFFSL